MDSATPPQPTTDLMARAAELSVKQREVLDRLAMHPHGAQVGVLAEEMGMHPNTIRGHLEELLSRDLVSITTVASGGRGRPSKVFHTRTPQHSMVTREYIGLVRTMAECLTEGDEEKAREIGRLWARQTHDGREVQAGSTRSSQLSALITILRDLGFDPSYPNPSGNISLNACPFTSVGVSAPSSVICALHAGFLEELSGGMMHRLVPYSRPSQCEIEL